MQERQSQEGRERRGKRDTEVREGRLDYAAPRALLRPSDDPTDDRKDERGAAGGGGGGVMGGAAGAHGGYRGATRRGGGRRRIHLKPAQTYKLILMLIL